MGDSSVVKRNVIATLRLLGGAALLMPTLAACSSAGSENRPGVGDAARSENPEAVAAGANLAEESRPMQRPNVLVIVADDQRATGTLRVMPKTRAWFQDEGTSFVNAYATTPLCCPSRASILTGRYAHNHGVHTNFDPRPLESSPTLPHHLQDAGYRTAIVGKYLNSWPLEDPPPHFDRWAIEDAYDYYDTTFNVNGRLQNVDGYSTTYLQRKALRFLKSFEHRDWKPWFLYVAPLAPHEPYTPAPRHDRAPVPGWEVPVERDRSDKPSWVRATDVPRGYIGKVAERQQRTLKSVDGLVGRLAKTLARLGEGDDTLAIYLSDNGYLWGEHGLLEKRLPYAPSVQIPLLLRWPGVIQAGRVDRRFAANIDVTPTVLDAVRVKTPRRLDGRSLLERWERRHLLLEYWRDPQLPLPAWSSIISRGFQYTEYRSRSGAVMFRELFDLVNDPAQLENVLVDDDSPTALRAMNLARLLERYRRCSGASCP